MNDDDFKESTEAHWQYTKSIIDLLLKAQMELCHKLYTEAMYHGWKHKKEEGVEITVEKL